MGELPSLETDEFGAFFEGIHGYPPFPWQTRLAEKVANDAWPGVLDLPTGSGKTAAIDIAVFRLALEAGAAKRMAPVRIVYVVDRRTIVDQAHQRAEAIRVALEGAQHPVLARVRARLASIGREGVPLRTALMRGAIPRSDLWARSPDQPLIAVSTVDQVGSRLLFRGYGVSDSMKPVHAGLLANDVLYLLDEVHLSHPFRETLGAVSGRFARWADTRLESPFAVVEMSATPGATTPESPFRLDARDEAHPRLSRRLAAQKPTRLVSSTGRGFLSELEKQVKPFAATAGATIAVVVNRVAAARELHARLGATLVDADVYLITGRMRPLDRDGLERELFPRIRAGRVRDASEKPVVVVATQCIEAGADFDFDTLITECASLDALRQRFGRLDRLGDAEQRARGVVVVRTDTLSDDPVYGAALGKTWRWLGQEAVANAAGEPEVDFGIRGLAAPDGAAAEELLAPTERAPVMLPSHLDAWVQTSPAPTPDPDVALWLHGPERGAADVQIVWRADLAASLLAEAVDADDAERRAEAREVALGIVKALPPASGEAMSVPFVAAKRWLDGRVELGMSDVEGAKEPAADDWKARREADARPAIAWRGNESSEIVLAARAKSSGSSADHVRQHTMRPGDTLVVPASYGGIVSGTWAPAAVEPVRDLAGYANLRQRGRAALRIHSDVLAGLLGDTGELPTPEPLDREELDDRRAVSDWLGGLSLADWPIHAREPITVLQGVGVRGLRVERLLNNLEGGEHFVVTARRRVSFDGAEVTTEDDRASFTGVQVSLKDHLRGVGDTAGGFAAGLGLAPELAADLELAGRWHDIGKVDPRFQRLLVGGSEFKTLVQAEPLAKSAQPMQDWRARRRAQERSGYPRGTRHEVMSVALMSGADGELRALAHDWDLVLHLVASHHGRCRPLAPWVADPKPVQMRWELDGVAVHGTSAHELARLDSGVADRFWRLVRRYGWWGLAWLEAILRLGDHRRSEEEQLMRVQS